MSAVGDARHVDASEFIPPERGLPAAPVVVATVHPASILRAPDDESREREREAFIDDMRRVRSLLAER